MSRRRINNPLDLTELEFKEISHKKLRKFQELAKKHNHIVVIGRNGAGKSTVLKDFKYTKDEVAYIDCANTLRMKWLILIVLEDKLFTQNALSDRMILWLWMNFSRSVLIQRANIYFIQ